MTPTQRTLKHLKDLGYTVGTVERWIPNPAHPGGGFRKDLFGFIDLIALTDKGVMAVQSTGQAFSSHLYKLTVEKSEEVRKWLETPGTTLYLYGWRKTKLKRGGKAMRWQPRIQQITIKDLETTNDKV